MTDRNQSPTDLLAEIARALADPAATSSELGALSERAAAAEAATGLLAADARQSALDPALPPERVAEALAEANAAAFNVTRLASARDALDALAETRYKAEKISTKSAARDHVIAERDRVAARLSAEYPGLKSKLVDLLTDVMEVNELVDAANREGQKTGDPILQRPEGMARGFFDKDDLSGGGAPYNAGITRLTQMVVPYFKYPEELAWPPGLNVAALQQLQRTLLHGGHVRAGFLASRKRDGR